MHRVELPRAQHAEGVEQLRPDRVLPPLAPREAQQRRAQPEAAGEAHEDAVHLVVGVGGDVQDAPRDADAAQSQLEAARAPVEIEGLEGRRRGEGGGEDRESDEHGETGAAGNHRKTIVDLATLWIPLPGGEPRFRAALVRMPE